MQLHKIVDAYQAVDQMRWMEYYNGSQVVRSERELPFDYAVGLVELGGKLKSHYEYFIAEEKKLMMKYAKKDENGNPVINGQEVKFSTAEEKTEFDAERTSLGETDVAIDGLPMRMNKPASVRCSWLEALDGFIDFV